MGINLFHPMRRQGLRGFTRSNAETARNGRRSLAAATVSIPYTAQGRQDKRTGTKPSLPRPAVMGAGAKIGQAQEGKSIRQRRR